MSFDSELLGLDFLVYSSHKTATQSLVRSLNAGGVKATHCHFVNHIGLNHEDFADYLDEYASVNARKLRLISVFRDPLDRLVSSFFQWHGSRPLRVGEANSGAETPIGKKSVTELQEIFLSDYCEKIDAATRESLDAISEQLSIDSKHFVFSVSKAIGVNEFESCTLYLLRFDQLVQEFAGLLSSITGKQINALQSNVSEAKFYSEKYQQFKASLVLPKDTIERIYRGRKWLIDLFYPGEYQRVLDQALTRYGG